MADSSVRGGHPADASMRDPQSDMRHPEGEASAFKFRERHEATGEDKGIADLLRDLTHQGSHLADQQMRLVQAEIRTGLEDIKEGVAAMAGAAVVGIAALGVFLMSISFLLGSAMPLWLGTLIVAVASMAGAYAMYAAGMKKLQSRSLSMDRTRHTIERAPSAVTGNEPEEQRRGR